MWLHRMRRAIVVVAYLICKTLGWEMRIEPVVATRGRVAVIHWIGRTVVEVGNLFLRGRRLRREKALQK